MDLFTFSEPIGSFATVGFTNMPQVIVSSSASPTLYMLLYDSNSLPYQPGLEQTIPGITAVNATAACLSNANNANYFFIADNIMQIIYYANFQSQVLGANFLPLFLPFSATQMACDGNYLYLVDGQGTLYYSSRKFFFLNNYSKIN